MKIYSILAVSSLLLQTCSASIWGSSKSDPIKAEKELADAPPFRFDYKLSFKKNFYYNGTVPFWTAGGDIHFADDFIRLSPSIPSARGYIWSDIPNPYDEWEVEIGFKVSGQHLHGGRGLAFWYAKEPGEAGPIFGSKDKWDGLSIWLDSAHPVTHKPTTMALLNDGSLAFASGKVDPTKRSLGSCSISYRNSENPTYLKVTYKEHILTVSMDNGSGARDFRTCMQRSDIKLPKGYYFGISAASHTPADDHDILSFETKQLDPPKKIEHPDRPLEKEKKKRGEEFVGIDEEQKKKIQEAEFQVKKLKETSEEFQGRSETAVSLAAIYDTQHRAIEHLQILQLQIEALGAPNPEDAIAGNYKVLDLSKLGGSSGENNGDSNSSKNTNDFSEQLKALNQKSDKIAKEQTERMKTIQESMARLEASLGALDKQIAGQSKMIRNKMNEVNAYSAETKGSLSTFLKYIFYAFVAQFLFGFAIYLYWKLRVERNDKKFV